MATSLRFKAAATGVPTPEVFGETEILGSTRGTGEIVVEYGLSHAFEPDGIATEGHFISQNLDSVPLEIDIKRGDRFCRVAMPPRSFFVQPAGVPMHMRNCRAVSFCAIELPTAWVKRVLGRDLALVPHHELLDERLSLVMEALMHEVASGGESGPLHSEALATAFVTRLARLSGEVDADGGVSGDRDRLRAIRDYIEERIGDALTVAELAQVAGLSVAHFSRAFKRETGQSPHAYITVRRLEHARVLLARGLPIAVVASRTGFADQSHLSRQFRQAFGMTPGAFQRSLRR